jgi:hypothetical protein
LSQYFCRPPKAIEDIVILIFELTWRGRAHVLSNAVTINTIACAFADENIHIFAEGEHLDGPRASS